MEQYTTPAPTRWAKYITLGCKLNFAETSSLADKLAAFGIQRAPNTRGADLCLINTCTVTETSNHKCRQAIHRARRENPQALLVVMGCYAQLAAPQIAAMEGVDLVISMEDKARAPKLILAAMNERQDSVGTQQAADSVSTLTIPALHHYSTVARKDIRTFVPSCSRGERTRFFLKVQDGCDNFCTYCAIPFARGRSRNGTIASMVEQARSVAAQGGKEIVITGVNIGDFGRTTHETFFSLIQALDNVDGIHRYRISSIEPDLLSDEIIDFCARSRHFMPHFHIPLQSGSDTVLRLMHRRYDTALFRSRIDYIKKVMPNAFIGVDIIVGMRGETEALFAESRRFAESLDVSQFHVFSYSERPGTVALKIPYIVSDQERHRRSKSLIAMSEQKRTNFYKSQIGQVRPVLTEHTPTGWAARGFTDNYVRVDVPLEYGPKPINTVIPCRLEALTPDGMALIGIPINS